jgi:hypothetical protein
MTNQPEDFSVRFRSPSASLATTLGAATGAAVGAVLGSLAGTAIARSFDFAFFGDDEAPIRVRHGSVDVELLDSAQEFVERGSSGKTKWKIRFDPSRKKAKYDVIALPSDCAKCPNGLILTGTPVIFTIDAPGKSIDIVFDGTSNKTRIDADDALSHDPNVNPRLLSAANYITKVVVDTKILYENKQYDPKLQILLLDLSL